MAPQYSAADFLSALQALMPRGRVWPRSQSAVQTKVLSGLAVVYARNAARAAALLADAFPATAYELLPEWEESLGLPDPCAGVAPTIVQRRAQVIARLSSTGGQSVPYLIAFAAALGYSITITQFSQARAGLLKAGAPAYGNDWNFTWRVNSPPTTSFQAKAGAMAAGDPLVAWGSSVLECELRAIAPAHTIVLFAYGGPGYLDTAFFLDINSLS